MANFKDGAQRLGATAAHAEDIYAYALALHGRQVRLFPQYRDRGCGFQDGSPPPLG
jgi:hypothetical protein